MIGKQKRNKRKNMEYYCLYEIRSRTWWDGGALPVMARPYKLFVGGTVGSGGTVGVMGSHHGCCQTISFAVNHDHLYGPVNITPLSPVEMRDFGKTIGLVLKRPHYFDSFICHEIDTWTKK